MEGFKVCTGSSINIIPTILTNYSKSLKSTLFPIIYSCPLKNRKYSLVFLPSPTKTGVTELSVGPSSRICWLGLDTGPPKDGEQSQDTSHVQWRHTRQCANPEACIQLAGSFFSERAACLVCERVFGVSEIDLIRAADLRGFLFVW